MIILRDTDNYKFQTVYRAAIYDLDWDGVYQLADYIGADKYVSLRSIQDYVIRHTAQTSIADEMLYRLDTPAEIENYVVRELTHDLVKSLVDKSRWKE